MADRMDDILRTIAREADADVDYAALREAILQTHKKKTGRIVKLSRMVPYAAALVLALGLGALALSRGILDAKGARFTAESARGDDMNQYGIMTGSAAPMAPEAAPMAPEAAPAPQLASAPEDGARNGGEAPDAGFKSDASGAYDQAPASLLAPDVTALAAEVLTKTDAPVMDFGTLSSEPDAALKGDWLCGGITCSTSYNGYYIAPLEGAPEKGKAIVADYGNGELRVYWSASDTLHVYAEAVGYSAEALEALLKESNG